VGQLGLVEERQEVIDQEALVREDAEEELLDLSE
jgi:hypothetical protein